MDRGSKPPVLKCRRALSASLVLNKSKDLLMPPHGRGGSSPLPGTISFQSIYADAANAVLSVFVWPVLVVVPVAVSASRSTALSRCVSPRCTVPLVVEKTNWKCLPRTHCLLPTALASGAGIACTLPTHFAAAFEESKSSSRENRSQSMLALHDFFLPSSELVSFVSRSKKLG